MDLNLNQWSVKKNNVGFKVGSRRRVGTIERVSDVSQKEERQDKQIYFPVLSALH